MKIDSCGSFKHFIEKYKLMVEKLRATKNLEIGKDIMKDFLSVCQKLLINLDNTSIS